MESQSLYAILSLAFGLGLVHALDADHIMAVSGLANNNARFANCVGFCLRWAIGHGIALLSIGICVFVLGLALPVNLSAISESLVGIMLIIIGAWIWWNLLRQNSHLHFHKHDGIPAHAHWHSHTPNIKHNKEAHLHNHHRAHTHNRGNTLNKSAVIIGLLHGTAGSAPLLAIIPLTQLNSVVFALLYLLLFGAGVLISMLIFGGILSGFYIWLSTRGLGLIKTVRISVGAGAISMGTYILYSGLVG